MSVRVDEVVGVAGYVLPGNRVDVLATANPTDAALRHDDEGDSVERAGADRRHAHGAGPGEHEAGAVTVVTLLVFPEQSERLALASTEGKIQLALRNPLDQGAPETPGIKTAGLMGRVTAPPAEGASTRQAAPRHARDAGRRRPGAAADGRDDSRRQARKRSHSVVTSIQSPASDRERGATGNWELVTGNCFEGDPHESAGNKVQVGAGRPHHRDSGGRTAGAAGDAAAAVRARGGRCAAAAAREPAMNAPTDIDLLVGRSTVVNVGSTIARVSLTVPDIADAMVTAPRPAADSRQAAGHDLAVRLGSRRRDHDVRSEGPPRPQRAGGADQAAVPRRADLGHRQRQGRRHLRHGLQPVCGREGRERGRRIRRKGRERRQPAEAAGRRGVEPGDAAGPLRRSEPQRGPGTRRQLLRQRFQEGLVGTDRAGGRALAGVRRSEGAGLQRLPQPVRLQLERGSWRCRSRAADEGTVPESRRAEPDRDQWQGSQLPRRRRVSLPGGAVRATATTPSPSCSRSSASV